MISYTNNFQWLILQICFSLEHLSFLSFSYSLLSHVFLYFYIIFFLINFNKKKNTNTPPGAWDIPLIYSPLLSQMIFGSALTLFYCMQLLYAKFCMLVVLQCLDWYIQMEKFILLLVDAKLGFFVLPSLDWYQHDWAFLRITSTAFLFKRRS